MITERGAVKVKTVMNDDVQKELNKTNFTLSIVYIVVGSILILAFIIGYVLSDIIEYSPLTSGFFLTLGVFMLFFGIIINVGCKKNLNVLRQKQQVEEMEFYGDYLICREYEYGEQVSVNKLYYGRVVRIKETKSFIFIYNTNVTALAVDKRTVDFNELTAIRSLLQKVGKVAPVVTNAAPVASAPAMTPPPDPFDNVKKEETHWTEPAKESEPAKEVEPYENQTEQEKTDETNDDLKDGGSED